ncbi:AAEL011149-PA [Aedes aegypti]|uniref:AAEL011149-PA n=1 Tax=Aedes aegypti TaxID=7159 RepID=Q16QV8_AEDAE|nr:AAEL011149-PA [Aedes aegypti]
MTGKKKNPKLKSATQNENESDTPKVKKSQISKKSLQFDLSKNKSDENRTLDTVNQLSEQFPSVAPASTVNQQVVSVTVDAAVHKEQDPTLSVAYQKQLDRDKKEKAGMDRALENLMDRQDLIIEKLFRIQQSIKTEAANNIHYLNLQSK